MLMRLYSSELSWRGAGDDQRRARLVDQDRVHLVDDGEAELTLQLVLQGEGHVVAQVVEAELVVGAVDDVGLVGEALLFLALAGTHDTDAEAEEVVDSGPIHCASRPAR
jgi:hypothetical protein